MRRPARAPHYYRTFFRLYLHTGTLSPSKSSRPAITTHRKNIRRRAHTARYVTAARSTCRVAKIIALRKPLLVDHHFSRTFRFRSHARDSSAAGQGRRADLFFPAEIAARDCHSRRNFLTFVLRWCGRRADLFFFFAEKRLR